ncbi:hypothetical protein QLQ12_27485 [Actinoplanes sp. NEAU-A12]|uniref:Integral membrane protein n=1 Tax=Actinoplanes sandaracinus TaxID=3045177 RepID=A0ABT6WRJ9_9ACTN|nr:hypothetical protein [Actinoplanes sandaracinus]MDI6102367.1 hypothetical protein [Actinoplanes sandaracinus]
MPQVDDSPDALPAWLLWPVRAIAVVVVLPFRLAGAALTAAGRFLSRYLVTPLAWLCHHVIVIPAAWLWQHLVVIPATWAWHHLVVVPLAWLWRTLLLPSARLLGRVLVKVTGWMVAIPVILIGVPVMWLGEHALVPGARLFHRWILRPLGLAIAATAGFLWTRLLVPAARAITWFLRLGWEGTSWLFRQLYRYLLRPIGLAAAFVWRHTFGALLRALAHVWRTLVTPAGRWIRDEILRPAGAAVRSVLASLGLR